MKHVVPNGETPATLKRLRSVLGQVPRYCEYGAEQHCQERLQTAVDRFCALDEKQRRRGQLEAARDHRERIEIILDFLGELDEITENEGDQTVFEEIAMLFADISRLGEEGAAILRALGGRSSEALTACTSSQT